MTPAEALLVLLRLHKRGFMRTLQEMRLDTNIALEVRNPDGSGRYNPNRRYFLVEV